MHTILIAKYHSQYDDHPAYELLGVFSMEKILLTAINDYIDHKRKHNAEILLEDTTFIRHPIMVDALGITRSI